MRPPLAVDIDGTLTRPDRSLDPRVVDALRAYVEEAPVVVATGKAFPYPVALCEFVGLPYTVVAENGGVVHVASDSEIRFEGDREAAEAVAADYAEAGYDLGWGPVDLVNFWRETELAVSRDRPLEPLERVAADHGMAVVDTGYAYHVKSPHVDKGEGLVVAAEHLGFEPAEFAAIGDSENDAEIFERVGTAYAVANADKNALASADGVTDASFADGFLEALEEIAG
jgi:phosphoglycolate phosphatase (TIGR01487 family)